MTFLQIATEIGTLVQEKNEAYGDSFSRAGDIMELLYPDGIMPSQYKDALGVVRVIDKLFRIATRKDAFGESPWKDIAGYGVLGAFNDQETRLPGAPIVPVKIGEIPEASLPLYEDDPASSETSLAPPNTIPDPPKYYLLTVCRGGERIATERFDDLPTAVDTFDMQYNAVGCLVEVLSPSGMVITARFNR